MDLLFQCREHHERVILLLYQWSPVFEVSAPPLIEITVQIKHSYKGLESMGLLDNSRTCYCMHLFCGVPELADALNF